MNKETAIREARVGALLHSGTYYVTCKEDSFGVTKYGAVSKFHYRPSAGRIVETFDMAVARPVVAPRKTAKKGVKRAR